MAKAKEDLKKKGRAPFDTRLLLQQLEIMALKQSGFGHGSIRKILDSSHDSPLNHVSNSLNKVVGLLPS